MNVQPDVPPELAKTLGLDKSGARRRFSPRKIVVAVLAIAVLFGIYLLFFSGGSGDAVRYVTEPAERGALTETVTATGTVEPTNQVEISSELSGTVREVLVDYNDEVKAGDVLARLDTDKLEAEVSHARATLAMREAQRQDGEATLNEAELAFQRTRALTERDYASQATRESAEATYQRALAGVAVAKANVEVAQADLDTAETNLKKASILSPINGVVLSRSVDPGATVAASLQAPVLFTIAEDLAEMQLEVDIDEADVGQVEAGQPATFTVEAYRERTFEAAVKEVRYASETINNVVTYTAVLTLDNSDLSLRPGMTATADITVNEVKDAVLVPNTALRFTPPAAASDTASGSGGGSGLMRFLLPRPSQGDVAKEETNPDGTRSIYVLQDGAPEKVSVKTGASDGTLTEVIDGPIEAGTPVITDSVTE